MTYRCVAASAAGFVQQLAVGYIAHGYYFYVRGWIPEPKSPVPVDQKLIAQYGLAMSKWTRARRKQAGAAGVQYLRCGRFFVLLATHGQHAFFTAEAAQIRDVRRCPLRFEGYSIGCRRGRDGAWHASVRIERQRFAELKREFERLAVHRAVEELAVALRAIPYEPYAPVRDQLRVLLRAVNRRRKIAGLELVPWDAPRWRRNPVRPFGAETECRPDDDAGGGFRTRQRPDG